jgi:hypothetical protein
MRRLSIHSRWNDERLGRRKKQHRLPCTPSLGESSANTDEMNGVAWAVINRWKIVNNQIPLKFPKGQLSFGPDNGSIEDIIGYRGSFEVVKGYGNADLTDAFQASLNRTLDSDASSENCVKIHNAIATAYRALPPELGGLGITTDPFKGRGFTTHFQRSPRVPDPHLSFFGPTSEGGVTNFFGVTNDQIVGRSASAGCDPNSPDYRACVSGGRGRPGGGRGR